ncbi:hypothetical protein ACA910_000723 [Epithemia clementina (nom. ined.)]
MYFTACFNTVQEPDDLLFDLLFPGNDQYQRFSTILHCCIVEHEAEVLAQGYIPSDIGTHSIRKGAITYMASLPGGPSIASICIRSGWTLGNVKDIYMR